MTACIPTDAIRHACHALYLQDMIMTPITLVMERHPLAERQFPPDTNLQQALNQLASSSNVPQP
jgi:hypothetical protein